MKEVTEDRWRALREFTAARIALGRAGSGQTTAANLQFQLDHARARDAVHLPLDMEALEKALAVLGLPLVSVCSRAGDRATYLQRPDLGRRLEERDRERLEGMRGGADIALVVADGLSSIAVQRHAQPFLECLVPALHDAGMTLAPLALVSQGRVAIGDDIGEALGARLSLVLIGERPGLSSPDSLGLYLTFGPRPGRADAERNCISNIRPPGGLGYRQAADTCLYLCGNALRRGLSGVQLKDDSMTLEHAGGERIPFLR